MGTISDYLEKKLLDHVLGTTSFTQPTQIYVALSTADPLDTGAGIAEPATGSYSRSIADDAFGTVAANRLKSNSAEIIFSQSNYTWGAISHFALYDAKTVGNMLGHGALTTGKTINSGDTARIGVGQLSIEFLNGGISTTWANKLLDFCFKGANYPFTSSAVYVALTTGSITGSMTGTNLPECTGSNYSRTSYDLWQTASLDGSKNYGAITFPTASSTNWGTIVSQALCTSGSTGQILYYGPLTTTASITTDDELTFASGALSITLD